MLTFILQRVKLAQLVVDRMSQSIVLCICMGFKLVGLCVVTVWASLPASIGDRRLFETWHLI